MIGALAIRRMQLLLLLLLCVAVHSVRAQMLAEHMHAAEIDWSSDRVITAVVLAALTMPLYAVGITLLVLRRKTHPIAGRGFPVLMLWACNTFVISAGGLVLHAAFPRGPPCGLFLFNLWIFAPFVAGAMVRVWFLVFRIEISEFLTELTWRQTKHAQILAHRSKSHARSGSTLIRVQSVAAIEDFTKAPSGKYSSISSGSTSSVPSDANHPCATMDLPNLDPASIAGHAFITNRRFTDERFVAAVFGVFGAGVVLMCCLVIAFDPDVAWTNSWRRARGLPDESFSSYYTSETITDAPRCLWYSMKMIAFLIAAAPAMPSVVWTGWRVRVNAVRAKQRAKEQAEFHQAILAGTKNAAGASSAASSAASPTRNPSQDIDELDFVKIELASAFCVAMTGLTGYIIETDCAYEYVGINSFVTGVGLFATTIGQAVGLSIRTSRKQRALMQRARQTDSQQSRRYTRGKFTAQIAHHRPLYRLQHILADPYAYPLLLKFLQKEYSSENALLIQESKRFAKLCKQIESQLPGWTSLLDEEDGETRVTGTGTVLGSAVGVRDGRSRLLPHGSPTSVVELVVEASPAPSPVRINGWQQQQQPASPLTPLTPMQARDSTPAATPSLRPLVAAVTASAAASSASPALDSPAQTPVRTPVRVLIRSDSGQHSRRDSESRSKRRAPWVVVSPTNADASPAPLIVAAAPAPPAATASSLLSAPLDPPSVARPSPSAASKRQLFIHTKLAPAAEAVAGPAPPQKAQVQQSQAHRLSFRAMHELAQQARDWALKIHTDYLQPNAVYQINIDSDLSRLVASQIAQIRLWQPTPLDSAGEPDFDRAAMESAPPLPPPFPLSSLYKQTALSVFALMESDSFRRFLLTQDFQLLLQRADDEEMARLDRQSDVTTRTMVAAADAMMAAQALQQPSAPEDEVTVLPGATEHEPAH